MSIDAEKLEEAIARMARYFGDAIGHSDLLVLNAARAHLAILPRYKEVEVWRVEWAFRIGGGWRPQCSADLSKEEAETFAEVCRRTGCSCISVTGPHKQRVPA